MAKRVSALLLALLLLTAGTANAGGVYYEIFPSSYRDTDGDGVGDLAGVTASAAYLQSLGVNGIWLTPFFSGATGNSAAAAKAAPKQRTGAAAVTQEAVLGVTMSFASSLNKFRYGCQGAGPRRFCRRALHHWIKP